jgi:hypothetical protein
MARNGSRIMLIVSRNGKEKLKQPRNQGKFDLSLKFAFLEFIADVFPVFAVILG